MIELFTKVEANSAEGHRITITRPAHVLKLKLVEREWGSGQIIVPLFNFSPTELQDMAQTLLLKAVWERGFYLRAKTVNKTVKQMEKSLKAINGYEMTDVCFSAEHHGMLKNKNLKKHNLNSEFLQKMDLPNIMLGVARDSDLIHVTHKDLSGLAVLNNQKLICGAWGEDV